MISSIITIDQTVKTGEKLQKNFIFHCISNKNVSNSPVFLIHIILLTSIKLFKF